MENVEVGERERANRGRGDNSKASSTPLCQETKAKPVLLLVRDTVS